MDCQIHNRIVTECRAEPDETRLELPEGAVGIAPNALKACMHIRELILPEGLRFIPARLCFRFPALTTVRFPDTLEEIGDYAFYGCAALTAVTLAEGIRKIGKLAFAKCTALTAASLPVSLQSVGSGIFAETALRELHIPEGTKELAARAFYQCGQLEHVYIPASVQQIHGAFYDCASLTAFTVAEDNPNYCSAGGLLYDRKKELLISVPDALEAVTLPDTLRRIAPFAFSKMRTLKEITLPDGILAVEEGTFMECEALEHVTLPKGLQQIDEQAFMGCTALRDIVLPQSVKHVAYSAFYNVPQITVECGDQQITFAPKQESASILLAIVQRGDYTEKPAPEVLYPLLCEMYRKQLRPQETEKVIRGCLKRMTEHLIRTGNAQDLDALLQTDALIGWYRADSLIAYAAGQEQTEITVMLMNYKNEKLGFRSGGGMKL